MANIHIHVHDGKTKDGSGLEDLASLKRALQTLEKKTEEYYSAHEDTPPAKKFEAVARLLNQAIAAC